MVGETVEKQEQEKEIEKEVEAVKNKVINKELSEAKNSTIFLSIFYVIEELDNNVCVFKLFEKEISKFELVRILAIYKKKFTNSKFKVIQYNNRYTVFVLETCHTK